MKILAVLLFSASVASGQTLCETACVVNTGQPFTVVTDAAACLSNCALLVNGVRVSVPWANNGTTLEFQFASGLSTPGTDTFTLEASGVQVTDTNSLQVIDLCKTLPLKFSVNRWPTQTTGNRSWYYSTNYPVMVSLEMRTNPWIATATDSRGCAVSVTR